MKILIFLLIRRFRFVVIVALMIYLDLMKKSVLQ